MFPSISHAGSSEEARVLEKCVRSVNVLRTLEQHLLVNLSRYGVADIVELLRSHFDLEPDFLQAMFPDTVEASQKYFVQYCYV